MCQLMPWFSLNMSFLSTAPTSISSFTINRMVIRRTLSNIYTDILAGKRQTILSYLKTQFQKKKICIDKIIWHQSLGFMIEHKAEYLIVEERSSQSSSIPLTHTHTSTLIQYSRNHQFLKTQQNQKNNRIINANYYLIQRENLTPTPYLQLKYLPYS